MLRKTWTSLVLLVLCCWSAQSYSAAVAEKVFADYADALLQIKVLEHASGAKSAIGSGFLLHDSDLVVTNYHVVSEAVLFPQKYQLEFLAQNQQKGALEIVAVDVVNDLALLKTDYKAAKSFQLQQQTPVQGATVYSLGNPHDLGLIVVPGTYNGLQKHSFYPRIHFTGAINSGMSGGPAVNDAGEVIGVNVASAGNDLGFLVPAAALKALLEKAVVADLKLDIQQQLIGNQQRMFQQVLEADWQLKNFGPATVPDEIVPFIRCWGMSNVEKDKDDIKRVNAFCNQPEEIFLSSEFSTGRIEMQFEWVQAKDLHPLQFFRRYQFSISQMNADNSAGEDDVTAFSCQNQLLSPVEGQHAKAIFCIRAYRNYPQLFDVAYISASMDHQQQGVISHFTLAGVDQQIALEFSRKFIGAVVWQ
ncbi:S1 family peptidase [Rheinheimera soli]|uniref:S1 family peptidase n=1 Tax=Rheinheimera soli TaxID=443616 RepID=UPI001E3A78B3|nr:serine protease [Rheinheimera soli]